MQSVTLNIGLYQIPAEDAERAVTEALEIGYRHLDTAAAYQNEKAVGRAIAGSIRWCRETCGAAVHQRRPDDENHSANTDAQASRHESSDPATRARHPAAFRPTMTHTQTSGSSRCQAVRVGRLLT